MPTYTGMTIVLVALIGVAIWGGLTISGKISKMKELASDPILLSEMATSDEASISALQEYYEDRSRCAQIEYGPDLIEKWPQLPAIVAGIKYALAQDEGWKPDEVTQELRRGIQAILEDPNFKIELGVKRRFSKSQSEQELLDLAARKVEFATGETVDENTVRLLPGADFNVYPGEIDPNDPEKVVVRQEDTGLAISVIHELSHVAQLRGGYSHPLGLGPHDDEVLEPQAYAFAGSSPPLSLVKAGDNFIRAASDCEKTQEANASEGGFVEFVGQAMQTDRVVSSEKSCIGSIPIRVYVAWADDSTSVQIDYFRYNVLGLGSLGPGSTEQNLKCIQGGRRVSHIGSFDAADGSVDFDGERGSSPEVVALTVQRDESGAVSAIEGRFSASDLFNEWTLEFKLDTPCEGGSSFEEFTEAYGLKDEDVIKRDAEGNLPEYDPPSVPQSGVILNGCVINLVPPQGGTLAISRSELPEWARERVLTVGAAAVCDGSPITISAGDVNVLLDGQPVARVGDATTSGGKIEDESNTIFVNGVPAAVVKC